MSVHSKSLSYPSVIVQLLTFIWSTKGLFNLKKNVFTASKLIAILREDFDIFNAKTTRKDILCFIR